jgi:hypothetical protein
MSKTKTPAAKVRKNLCGGFDESVRDKLSEIIFNALYKRFGDGEVQLATHKYVKESERWVAAAQLLLEEAGWRSGWFDFIECCVKSRFGTHRVHMDHKDESGMVNVTLAKSTAGHLGGSGGKLWNVSIPKDDAFKVLALGFPLIG